MEFKTLGEMQNYFNRLDSRAFHKHLEGHGGLGYHQHKGYRMIGGMAFQNVNTGHYDHELFEEFGANNMVDLITRVIDYPLWNENDKMNFLLKEYLDFEGDLKERNKILNDEDRELEREKISLLLNKQIDNLLNKGYELTELQAKEFNQVLTDPKYKENPFYKYEKNKAIRTAEKNEVNIQRGNLTEEDITESYLFTELIDKDKSKLFNTKMLEAYSDEFKNFLVDIATNGKYKNFHDLDLLPKEEMVEVRQKIFKDYLEYIPIDLIKGETLYEVKSFQSPINKKDGFQEIGKSKLFGYTINTRDGCLLNYSFGLTDDGKKVENILCTYKTGKTSILKEDENGDIYEENIYKKTLAQDMPILKNRPDGYNYYWLLSNSDTTGYINPLQDDIYKGLTKQHKKMNELLINNPDRDINTNFKIKNKFFKIMPNSYMQIFKNEYLMKNKDARQKRNFLKKYIKKTFIKE